MGYSGKSKRYIFYGPNNSQRMVKIINAKFLENVSSESEEWQNIDIKEVKVNITLPISVHSSIVVANVVPNIIPNIVIEHYDNYKQYLNENKPYEETNSQRSEQNESQEVPFRTSQRERK